jgi:hypothetical protein
MSRRAILAVAVLVVYLAGYLAFRETHIEVWERDQRAYVIFPCSALYYLWRPLSYVDGALTGMQFHIGPHQ